ncbi:MAG: hypothetical protein LBB74_11145 [Chitinispirillales bacterium]|jgi:hypothetical protein|nr:hypothetical protein [Chitinispirillales bacterium]
MENNKDKDDRARRAAEIQSLPARYVELGEPMDKKAAEVAVRVFGEMKNDNDGRRAILPVDSVGKILRHRGYELSRIIKSIPELYKTSLFGWSERENVRPGHKEHPNIKEYHNYINKFTDGDGEYYIRFTVNEETAKPNRVGRNIVHSAAVSDITLRKAATRNVSGLLTRAKRARRHS